MVAQHTLTEFLQHSGAVLPEVEEGEVRLRRRDGDDLVLVTARHWDQLAACVRVLAEDVHVHAAGGPGAPRFAVGWLALLRPDDRAACVAELRAATLRATETGELAKLAVTYDAWRATALATWDDEQHQSRDGYAADDVRPLARP